MICCLLYSDFPYLNLLKGFWLVMQLTRFWNYHIIMIKYMKYNLKLFNAEVADPTPAGASTHMVNLCFAPARFPNSNLKIHFFKPFLIIGKQF